MRLRFGVVFLFAAVSLGALRLTGCGGPQFVTGGADGGPTLDAGPGDAAPPALPFCSSIDADFCSDFDQLPLPESWTKFAVTGGSSGVEDDDASVSPPNSFLATVPTFPAVDAGTAVAGSAILTKLSLPKGQTHIAFSIRIDEISFPDPSDLTATIVTAAYTQGTDYAVALEFHPSATGAPFAAALLELTTPLGGTTTSKVDQLPGVFTDLGTWYQVVLDFGIDTSDAGLVPASISVTSGGTTTTKLVDLTVPLDAIGGARTLSVGVQATPPTGEAKIRFDNVTYTH
ncbi:MAG: hypothetical protein ACLQVI_29625 [Polyangiaceae bacterium]